MTLLEDLSRGIRLVILTRIANTLNRALELDREAITRLFETRVPINKELDDSDVPLVAFVKNETEIELGVMGVLNGLFCETPGLMLVTQWDGETLLRFEVRDQASPPEPPKEVARAAQ